MFDIGRWHASIISISTSYRWLFSYLRDEDAWKAHHEKLCILTVNENGEVIESNNTEIRAPLIDEARKSLDGSLDHYSSLMIVAAATYLEGMLKDMLFSYFFSHPLSMNDYVAPPESGSPGKVPLYDIFSESSLDDVKEKLATRSANNAANGSFRSVARRIKKLTKREINSDLTAKIEEIFKIRNKVVHEAANYAHEDIDINQTYNNLLELLVELGRACKHASIPYSDPGFLIDSYPDPE